uniref:Ty3 transposon capsid-like protein domain-containing protein n=1 Tax=Tanacetum cinerariifolium TaxID=118510 RepID=A0A699GYJ4_TANCI|nr:hypothetical protein [Tanacetum cinerariifolium]
MVNVISPDHVHDVPVVELNQHDDVHVVLELILVDEDEDPEEDKFKEEEEPQEEKEDDMEVDIEEDENEPELTYPYEDVDPLNPSPNASDLEPEDAIEVEDTVESKDETISASVHEVAAIHRMITKSVYAAIAAERARHANAGNDARGSGPSTKGAVELQRWFEKTESVFGISECVEGKKVKFTTATLQGHALTWWNAKVATIEHELWNLKVKEYNIVTYTQRFNELALMCPRMVEPESVNVDGYIRGLTNNIKGEVTPSKPANLNEAVRVAYKLMKQKSQARDERILEGKKQKWENFQSGNSSGKRNHKDN